MQDSAASAELRGLTLITCSLGEVVESLLARNFQTDRFKSRVHHQLSILVTRTLLRAALSLSMLRGFAVTVFCTRRACSDTTDDALWAMRRLHT
jgi:hypothetical protein